MKPLHADLRNHQHYQNDQTTDLLASTPIEAAVNATSGIDKMNQYNRIGDYVVYWQYATGKLGFGKVGCVVDGAS